MTTTDFIKRFNELLEKVPMNHQGKVIEALHDELHEQGFANPRFDEILEKINTARDALDEIEELI